MACVTKDYGIGADCSLGTVEIDPAGGIAIHSDAVEMGNGIGTALANRVAAYLGGVADEVTVAQVDAFEALELVTSGELLRDVPSDAGRRRRAIRAGCLRSARATSRLDRRACRNASGGRGRAHRVPLRVVAGGARSVGHRPDRSEREAVGGQRAGRTGSS